MISSTPTRSNRKYHFSPGGSPARREKKEIKEKKEISSAKKETKFFDEEEAEGVTTASSILAKNDNQKGLESEYLPAISRPPYLEQNELNENCTSSPFGTPTCTADKSRQNISPTYKRHNSLDPSKHHSSSTTSLSTLTSPFLRRRQTTIPETSNHDIDLSNFNDPNNFNSNNNLDGGRSQQNSSLSNNANASNANTSIGSGSQNNIISKVESTSNLSSSNSNHGIASLYNSITSTNHHVAAATPKNKVGITSATYKFVTSKTSSKHTSVLNRPKTTFINCPSTIQASLNLMFNNNNNDNNHTTYNGSKNSVTVNMNNINGSMLQQRHAVSKTAIAINNLSIQTPNIMQNNHLLHNNYTINQTTTIPPFIPHNKILVTPTWRLKERMKTVGIGLILALNIGTDPPDIHKPNPCAKLICWMDPTSTSRAKAKDKIGELLKNQYMKWQGQQRTRLKNKVASDPTVEDVRSLCFSMRRAARNERLLLHYNGHGVPRPTPNGEIWVFDSHHRQYIPLAVSDVRKWIGKPTLLVLDCSGGGALMKYLTCSLYGTYANGTNSEGRGSFLNSGDIGDNLNHISEGDKADGLINSTSSGGNSALPPDFASEEDRETSNATNTVRDLIVLCPTSASENLPMNPELPADLFTSCLTTPIRIALRWFVHQNPLSCTGINPDDVDLIPGELADRKTPLGELNWIFTAVTDNIAWNVLPSALFQRLFRQDLLVASMFRNFLLADRILRGLNCTPMSHPALPPTCDHPLWQAWDLAIETCLSQLIRDGVFDMRKDQETEKSDDALGLSQSSSVVRAGSDSVLNMKVKHHTEPVTKSKTKASSNLASKSAPFFSEQLTAFEVWLDFAANRIREGGIILNPPKKCNTCNCGPFDIESPDQLPVVLQVLLSPAHRVRALILLRRFLNLGPSAVNLALSVGIFPYVLRLLQSQIDEYKHVLVGIWNKILEFDPSCQVDLVKDNALSHFINHLNWGNKLSLSSNSKEDIGNQKTMAAVILAAICSGYPNGQTECMKNNLHGVCCKILQSIEPSKKNTSSRSSDKDSEKNIALTSIITAEFRMWLCICLGVMFDNIVAGIEKAFQSEVHVRLFSRTKDDSSQVRAAACFALGSLVGPSDRRLIKDEDLAMEKKLQNKQIATQMLSPSPMAYNASKPQPGLSPLGNLMMQKQQFSPTLQQLHPIQQYSNMPYTPTSPGALFPQNKQDNNGVLPSLQPPLVNSPPSVFEEKPTLVRDLIIIEKMINMYSDACPTVRFEAVVVLGKAVDRYLMAFVCVANASSNPKSDDVETVNNPIPMPEGVETEAENLFNKTWKLMRFSHAHDPHPAVASAATAVLKFVNEHILVLKSNFNQTEKSRSLSERRLDVMGIGAGDTGEISTSKKYLRTHSALNLGRYSDSVSPFPSPRRLSSLHEVNESDESERSESMLQQPEINKASSIKNRHLDDHVEIDSMNILPSSRFYQWKKQVYEEQGTSEDLHSPDPLSMGGALDLYRVQRNSQIDQSCAKMSESFKVLQPKRKRQNIFDSLTGFDSDSTLMDLDDDSKEKSIDSEISAKKKSLYLEEKALLFNDDKSKGTYMLRFHSYESLLASSDGNNCVTIWDVEQAKKAAQITNCIPSDTRMTSMHWLNERNNSLLLTGCDDGSVRIYDNSIKNSTNIEENAKLSTAFFAMPELEPNKRRSGLVTEWQQCQGRLVAGGNTNMIRCWDLESEKCSTKIATDRISACLTSFASAWDYVHSPDDTHGFSGIHPDVVLSGYSDGVIRIIDFRTHNPKSSASKSYRRRKEREMTEHTHWIVNLCFTQCGGNHEIVSGSILGEVKFWDMRNLRSSVDTQEVQRSPMTAFVSHPRVPLLASGSHANFVKLFTPDGDFLQLIRHHNGSSGRKIGPVSVLGFHPNKLMLAVGATDEVISIYDASKGTK